MPPTDTRLDWRAIEAVANGRPVAPVKPGPWDLLTHPPDPRERLTGYLDTWAGMDEATWTEASVKALFDDIMDVFRDHPEADGWFREWRAVHPEARLA